MYPFVQFHAKISGPADARRATIHELPQFLYTFKGEAADGRLAADLLRTHISELMRGGFEAPMGNSRPKVVDKKVLPITLTPEDGVIMCLYMHMTRGHQAPIDIRELAKRVRANTEGFYTAAEVTKLFTFPKRVDMALIRHCFAATGMTFDISVFRSQHKSH